MALMSEVEKELIKATKVKPDKYDDRQDFLAAICKAMEPARFSEEAFDALSDEAAEWHTKKAVPAMNRKLEIPDFTDHEAEEAAESAEADEEAEDEVDDAEDEDSSDDDDPEDEDEAEPDESVEAPSDDEDADSDPEPVVKPKGKGKPAKPTKAAKPAKPTKTAKPAKEAPKAKPKAEAKPPKAPPRDYTGLTGEKDKFGIVKGTQTSQAAAMYEKGATAKEIKDALDGRYYNVLKRLEGEGHQVEKLEGGVWKLTHRDNLKGKPKAKAPAKKGK